ncbi:MAG: aminomethyltransferase beta-barrel domain-containing protein, partial [Rhodospirillales bacterium]
AAPEFGIAPGQACVFYDGDRVLGGGWIRRDDFPGGRAGATGSPAAR